MAFSSFGTGKVLIVHKIGQNGPYFWSFFGSSDENCQNAKRIKGLLSESEEYSAKVTLFEILAKGPLPDTKNCPSRTKGDESASFLSRPARTFLILLESFTFLQKSTK